MSIDKISKKIGIDQKVIEDYKNALFNNRLLMRAVIAERSALTALIDKNERLEVNDKKLLTT